MPLLKGLDEWFHLPMSVQKILDCKGHITGGHKKGDKFVAETLFDPMKFLDREKKILYKDMFYGFSLCRKAQKY